VKYNPLNLFEKRQAELRFSKLLKGSKPFELIECQPKRTNQQNSLLHVWFTVFADCMGYTSMEDAKRDVKRHLLGQKPIENKLEGVPQYEDYRTRDMTVPELSKFMDAFKIWAQTDCDCYLPYNHEEGYEQMIEQYKNR